MTTAENPDPIAALRDKFTVRDTVSDWLIGCPKCRKRWALEKPAAGEALHPGNVLALLEHAHGHRAKAPPPLLSSVLDALDFAPEIEEPGV